MLLIYHDKFLEHNKSGHPENKNRLLAIKDILNKYNHTTIEPVDVLDAEKKIKEVHSDEYVELIKNIKSDTMLDSDTYIVKETYNVAVKAVAASINAADYAADKKDSFALVRPPGHHACKNRGMGFCIFNNIAIAAEYMLSTGKAKKILLLDIDCHHGNGTQEIFYARKDVYYISLHQYPAYPGTGSADETGVGEGKNFTLNIPLRPYTTDDEYIEKLKIFRKVAIDYNPDVILVSAGYDTYTDDPLTSMNITIDGFGKISKYIKETAKMTGVGVAFILEGGYNLRGLSEGVLKTIND
ncbi:MAG: histone deacetylase [Candidatus Altiarchaeales archaeon HGW-Altiarchaeales-2]|nr:MAG: histone deacetylase [Candidatus Altiarchaeales archaeon HGW-Altiarchaeales-2]